MVERQIASRGVRDPRVLAAMMAVPRHAFVPPDLIALAYSDQALPTRDGQTISQPYVVASMAEMLELSSSDRVLEIGAGSGYQAAVLSQLAREIYAVEVRPGLAEAAGERLRHFGCANVHVQVGDGTLGWPEQAPFDAILVTAAAPFLPPPLVAQLAEGGRLLVPLGKGQTQRLTRVRRRNGEILSEELYEVRFVPLVGRYGWPGLTD